MKKFGSKLKIKESKKSIQNKEKDAFIETINAIELCTERAIALEELGFDIEKIEEPYMIAIEKLLGIHYPAWKVEIIYWYIYDRTDEEGNNNPITIAESPEDEGKEVIIENALELWELLNEMEQKIKSKNEEE